MSEEYDTHTYKIEAGDSVHVHAPGADTYVRIYWNGVSWVISERTESEGV